MYLGSIRWGPRLLLLPTTSLLLAASWLDARLYLTTWLGYALFFVLAAMMSPWRMFLAGAAIGGAALAMAFHWAPDTIAYTLLTAQPTAWLLFAGFVAWESIPFGLLGAVASRSLRQSPAMLWFVPVTWVVLEQFWPKVFPWLVAHSQTDFVALLQIAELVGGSGISLVMISVALLPAVLWVAVLDAPTRPEAARVARYYAPAALLLLSLTLGFGWTRRGASKPPQDGSALRTALVQVEPGFVDSVEKMRERWQAIDADVDLVCWPESSLGAYSASLPDFRDPERTRMQSLPPYVHFEPLKQGRAELLAGGKSYGDEADEDGPFHQTAYLIRADGTIAGRYMKRTLMPIGEYVPGQSIFPALQDWAYLDESMQTGHDARPLTVRGGAQVGVLICYEDTQPANARSSVAAGAQVLFSIMNAAAFESPLALEQHLRLALLRAVENRRYFARCAGTGVSCIVAPSGRIVARAPQQTETTLVAAVPCLTSLTLFTQGGHYFPHVLAGVLVVAAVYAGLARRRADSLTKH